MKKSEEELRLYLTYDEHRDGGEAINPDERFSDRTPEIIYVSFHTFYRKQPTHRFFYTSIEVEEEVFKSNVAYLAVVRYSTGDTFGHTEGAWHIVDAAFSYEEAEKVLQHALSAANTYKPWEGYFERFEKTEIHELIVKE